MSLHDDLLEQAEQLAKIIVPCLLPSVETLGRRPTLRVLGETVVSSERLSIRAGNPFSKKRTPVSKAASPHRVLVFKPGLTGARSMWP